jgi:hypothetical protein
VQVDLEQGEVLTWSESLEDAELFPPEDLLAGWLSQELLVPVKETRDLVHPGGCVWQARCPT